MGELVALLNGVVTGVVEQDRKGNLSFSYRDGWRDNPEAYPLSLSMPLARRSHPDAVVRPFLEGLLPDNQRVLERWGRRFQVSPRNPFALLTYMGEDCAGAVQFVEPSRLDSVTNSPGSVDWLTEEQVGELLRDLAERHGTGRFTSEEGQFSLAGAQPKTALHFDGREWGIPRGRMPSTHILKPPAQPQLDGLEVNEHFCLNLAASLDIPAARSQVRRFAGQPTIVVQRYDRAVAKGERVVRLHQEDACQALGVTPLRRYENEGGPAASDIVSLLLWESTDPASDVGTFVDAMILNWAILGTDAHAKNYSLMLQSHSVRLAPLYDLLSALPYDRDIPYRRAKLAMRVDREYLAWKLRRRHWEGFAARCDLDPHPLIQRAVELLAAIPEAAQRTAALLLEEGLPDERVFQLEERVTTHSQECLALVGNPQGAA